MTVHREGEFDAIVVGSGPGGATVARELSRRKKRVLLLERGGAAPPEEGFRATASIVDAVPVGENLAAARALTTGGTTSVYFGVAGIPPLDVFRSLGIDLSRPLEEARSELPLAVLPDELLGAQALRVRDSALALGYPWKKNTMLVDISKCTSGYTYEAKWKAGLFVRDAVEAGATLLTRAKVRKVLVDRNTAVGVEYELGNGKKHVETRRALGARVILAAGAAASPVILRDSGMQHVAEDGFYCHPCFGVFGMVSGLKAGETFTGSMEAELEDGIACGDGNFARTFYRMFMLGSGRVIRAWLHSRSIAVGVMVKDGLGGGLREDGRYHKELTPDETKRLKAGEEIARKIIRHAGGKRLFQSRLTAAHLGGTIRIGKHVDENLQTEWSNLHVCDGAVIPESVAIPPTLTLICLGKHLANHLSQTL
jgi:choline dehydrogenase-like flavoprotein